MRCGVETIVKIIVRRVIELIAFIAFEIVRSHALSIIPREHLILARDEYRGSGCRAIFIAGY